MKIIRKMLTVMGSIVTLLSPLTVMSLHYEMTPLVSDGASSAPNIDPNLLNPWGLFFCPSGNFWVADNGSNLSTEYEPNGNIINFVIQANESPTGAKFNASCVNFLISTNNPAKFIYSTEAGTILGFNCGVATTSAVVVADQSLAGAVYKGLEIGTSCCQDPLLFATDFHNNKIDVFDKNFAKIGSFKDSSMPIGFAPFNIKQINDKLYVTYAKQLPPENRDDQAGFGNGYVDVFALSGTFLTRLISQGNLNSPWGLALAPSNFGEFSNALLVGNFGDGKINAYDISTGLFLGQVSDTNNIPIVIDGLWSLEFDVGGILYFSSGPNQEADGLVGIISPLP